VAVFPPPLLLTKPALQTQSSAAVLPPGEVESGVQTLAVISAPVQKEPAGHGAHKPVLFLACPGAQVQKLVSVNDQRAVALTLAGGARRRGRARRARVADCHACGRRERARRARLEAAIDVSEEARRRHAVCQHHRALVDRRGACRAGLAGGVAQLGLEEANCTRFACSSFVSLHAYAILRVRSSTKLRTSF
jgi:hypothetical protein